MLTGSKDTARLNHVDAELSGTIQDLGRIGTWVEPDLADILTRHLVEDLRRFSGERTG